MNGQSRETGNIGQKMKTNIAKICYMLPNLTQHT